MDLGLGGGSSGRSEKESQVQEYCTGRVQSREHRAEEAEKTSGFRKKTEDEGTCISEKGSEDADHSGLKTQKKRARAREV
eukprot:13106560-Alexandrium_andersonii.AAC.1